MKKRTLDPHELKQKEVADLVATAVRLKHRTAARQETDALTVEFQRLYERWAVSGNRMNALGRKLFEKLERLDVGHITPEQIQKARAAQAIAPAKRIRRKPREVQPAA